MNARYVDAVARANRQDELRDEARASGELGMPGPKPGSHHSPRVRAWDPTRDKPAKFNIPVNFDLQEQPDHLRWPIAFFLNLVKWKQGTWRFNDEGYSQLKTRYLNKVILPSIWSQVRSLLTESGVVEEDDSVIPGKKCRGYRLTPDYWEGRTVVCTDNEINAAVHRAYCLEDRELQPVHRWLKGNLALVQIDQKKALEIVSKIKPKKLSAREHRRLRSEHVKLLAGNDWRLAVDEYGRVHTPITSLEKELRTCLSVGNRPLVWIDLKNSQPLMLGLLVRQFIKGNKWARERLIKRGFNKSQPYRAEVHSNTNRNPPTTPPIHTRITSNCQYGSPYGATDLKQTVSAIELPLDLERYLRVCEAGRFYESLMTRTERERGKPYRRRFKERFFTVLFGENRPKGRRWPNLLKRRFRKRYPTLASVLWQLKRRNYRHSSHLLQNLEATLFIHRVCGRIMREKPGIFVATVHDCIATTKEHVSYVEGLILDELGKRGIKPTLEIEDKEEISKWRL
jgi:hypothetical protein